MGEKGKEGNTELEEKEYMRMGTGKGEAKEAKHLVGGGEKGKSK